MVAMKSPPKPRGRPSKARVAANDTQTALAAMPDALRVQVLDLSTKIDQRKEDEIHARMELGRRFTTIRDDDTGQYGDDPLKAIASFMPLSKDAIRPMMVIAEAYTDPEMDQLLALRHPVTSERLTWTHISALSRIKDKAKVLKLADQAVAEGWSSRDLNRKIIQSHGGPRSKGGRKTKRPGTIRDAVTDVAARSATWVNAADSVWLAPGGLNDLYEACTTTAGQRPDQGMSDGLDGVSTQLLTMQMKLAALIQTVNALKHRADAARTPKSVA